MTFQQELSSWNPFNNPQTSVKDVPQVGTQAPSVGPLRIPREDKKPVIISFLRHCGCPCNYDLQVRNPILTVAVAEKAFHQLRDIAAKNTNIHCIAVSHSDQQTTEKWLRDVGGKGDVDVDVIVDDERELFAAYGLTYSRLWDVINPWSLKAAFDMGKEGFQVRPTSSGSRWQTAGLFSMDGNGSLTYAHKANTSDDLGDLTEALQSVTAPRASL
jgi:predicted transport protein